MQITTIEGVVKNGQILLSEDVNLPESSKVYVVVPDLQRRTVRVMSPRLVNKADAAKLVKTVEADIEN